MKDSIYCDHPIHGEKYKGKAHEAKLFYKTSYRSYLYARCHIHKFDAIAITEISEDEYIIESVHST